ncbi:MAG TPA: nucleoid-associated protein [Candidatus Acidoferrum sp.]
MITPDDLATTTIRHVIFHDVPEKGHEGSTEPMLSDVETRVDGSQKNHLLTKLTRVITSTKSYPVRFLSGTASPVPKQARLLTADGFNRKRFVDGSRELANYLFEQHTKVTSPGLLCVIDAASGGNSAIVLMKLERERGAQLELGGKEGERSFSMSVLNDLVLTDGTRLFKSAMFIRTGAGDDDFKLQVCEGQNHVFSADDLAQFWMRFLGCGFVVEPRVATQRFFESTLDFISNVVTEPTVKAQIYEHLQSQMKANTRSFAPQTFIQEYVPEQYQEPYREHLQADNVPLAQFRKDLADIERSLERRLYKTKKGGMISVPTDVDNFLEIRSEDILIKDTVAKVK